MRSTAQRDHPLRLSLATILYYCVPQATRNDSSVIQNIRKYLCPELEYSLVEIKVGMKPSRPPPLCALAVPRIVEVVALMRKCGSFVASL